MCNNENLSIYIQHYDWQKPMLSGHSSGNCTKQEKVLSYIAVKKCTSYCCYYTHIFFVRNYGYNGKECFVSCYSSTAQPRRLTGICTTRCTWRRRVTCSRTSACSWSTSTGRRPRRPGPRCWGEILNLSHLGKSPDVCNLSCHRAKILHRFPLWCRQRIRMELLVYANFYSEKLL